MTRYREVNELPRCCSCGKLLTSDAIRAERVGHPVVFCSEQCVRVFDTYKEPKYGEAAVWPESIVR
jgi:hypothetical protein